MFYFAQKRVDCDFKITHFSLFFLIRLQYKSQRICLICHFVCYSVAMHVLRLCDTAPTEFGFIPDT